MPPDRTRKKTNRRKKKTVEETATIRDARPPAHTQACRDPSRPGEGSSSPGTDPPPAGGIPPKPQGWGRSIFESVDGPSPARRRRRALPARGSPEPDPPSPSPVRGAIAGFSLFGDA